TSRGGAVSISYEGIRCESFERRVYAFGHKDGTWTRSRRTAWTRILRGARNDAGETLALDFFCEGTKQVGTVPEIVERIRYKRERNPRVAY
ncbi:MAG: CNP1-like family protein, partial [Lacisediminimonas sp.]|nr:CNP1-like family protein [Lacisediminimonas sp.]